MNKLVETMKDINNMKETENGARAHRSTLNKVYDLFAFGGAYRKRSEEDCILLFKEAYEEDSILALKCLFYLRDVLQGQGERRFFRICFKWYCDEHIANAVKLLPYIPYFGRWDDIIYSTRETSVYPYALHLVKKHWEEDIKSDYPSLMMKWLPSVNASSQTTKEIAKEVREYLGLTEKEYRKILSRGREKIKVLEKLMSDNRWTEIDFEHIPSKAGLKYRNAFERRDLIAEKYKEFAKSKDTKVNAKSLYPYEIVCSARHCLSKTSTQRNIINKYWENLPDYLGGKPCKMLCVCDTSGSMTSGYSSNIAPIDVAISLSMYCAERIGESFRNQFITFSYNPEYVEIKGVDFVDKVERIYRRNQCENTNLEAVFDLLLNTVKNYNIPIEDIPETIVIISDMEIDDGSRPFYGYYEGYETTMQKVRNKWRKNNIPMPKLVYWNVDARNNTILDKSDDISFVSGCSPAIFESILTGVTGKDLMLQKLNSDRYKDIM